MHLCGVIGDATRPIPKENERRFSCPYDSNIVFTPATELKRDNLSQLQRVFISASRERVSNVRYWRLTGCYPISGDRDETLDSSNCKGPMGRLCRGKTSGRFVHECSPLLDFHDGPGYYSVLRQTSSKTILPETPFQVRDKQLCLTYGLSSIILRQVLGTIVGPSISTKPVGLSVVQRERPGKLPNRNISTFMRG